MATRRKRKAEPPVNLDEVFARPTCKVPEAAKVLGLRGNGYAEAKRGEIPTIKFGRRMMVPTAVLKRMLTGEQLAA